MGNNGLVLSQDFLAVWSVTQPREGHMPKSPNLFDHATSELSQDAFICWLLDWADPRYVGEDEALHNRGVALIHALFAKHHLPAPEIESVEIQKQEHHIDILCVVNKKYAVIIEDKTDSVDHSDQLNRYFNDVLERGPYSKDDILRIYFKTGDQCSYKDIEDKGYKVFGRSDFLKVLHHYDGSNQIFRDYRDHLQELEDKVSSFRTRPISSWQWEQWVGFYKELQKHMEVSGWDYVANPRGGFLGLWWHFIKKQNCKLYLQLEEENLCFKIEVDKKHKDQRATLREKWHREIMTHAKTFELELEKPKRFGLGSWMTLCILRGEYRQLVEEKLDIKSTVSILQRAENLLDSLR
jgi:hypothetical protein